VTHLLSQLGVSHADILRMRADLLVEFKRRTNDLLHAWSRK